MEENLLSMLLWDDMFISEKPRESMKGYSYSREDYIDLLYHKYFSMDEELNGCIGLWEKVTDYKLTEWLLDALPTLYQQDEIIFQYNQGKQDRSKKSCTIFSPVGAISDLFNVEIPLTTVKEWDKDSYNRWRNEWEWWLVALGVELIADKWNSSDFAKQYGKVAYYSIDLKDNELVKKVLEKRYSICTGFNGNAKYNNDKNDNWVLNGTSFWSTTYGHAVSAIWGIDTPTRIKDNYYGTSKYNIYWVEHEFSQIPCFFSRGYVFTKVAEDTLEEVKRLNKMKTLTENMIANNSEMWELTNDKPYRIMLHDMNEKNRSKLKDIEAQLKKYM